MYSGAERNSKVCFSSHWAQWLWGIYHMGYFKTYFCVKVLSRQHFSLSIPSYLFVQLAERNPWCSLL
uniref:Uncharacterized protein n=1 Tax=Rhizophora mucronata TaxID=61149 RepID=A0A2P2PF67_RHIMU